MKHLKFFEANPVFTTAEFAAHCADSHGGTHAAKESLRYHSTTGRIRRVRRGLYAVMPKTDWPERPCPVPVECIAAKLAPDAIPSHYGALAAFKSAHFLYSVCQYTAAQPPADFHFCEYKFHGLRLPRSLRGVDLSRFNRSIPVDKGICALTAGVERTIVDCLHRPIEAGGWESIWLSLEYLLLEDWNPRLVADYVELLHCSTTAAKVGFFFERNLGDLPRMGDCFDRLRALRPKQMTRLDPDHQETRKIPGWNLELPREVALQEWDNSMAPPSLLRLYASL